MYIVRFFIDNYLSIQINILATTLTSFCLSFLKQINLCGLFHVWQPNVGVLNRSPAGSSAGGMLDRSRMALCAFTFLFLSLNPLAALLSSPDSSSTANTAAAATHSASRTVKGIDIAGMVWV